MDAYDIRRSTYNLQLSSADKPKMYQSPSAARIAGASVISSSSDYKRISDDLDKEFMAMKAQTEEKRNTARLGDELDRFSSSNEYSGIGKNPNDRLAERLFNELHYRQENEDRARTEINNMKQRISNIEKHLATAKEIQLKRELGDLLVERETLADLEKELYRDIVIFKESYEKRKRSKSQYEMEEESQKLRELRRKKEQVDVERARMKSNLEKAEKGDWRGIERDSTKLLKEAQAKRAKSFLYNPNPYDLENMKAKISKGTERVQELRRDREELLKYGVMNKYSNVKETEEDLSEKMGKYLEEIERSKMSAIEKADKMRKFREKMARLLNEDGTIDPLNHQKAFDLLDELQQKQRLHPKSYENSMRVSPRSEISTVPHHHHAHSAIVHPAGEDPMASGFRDLGVQITNPAKLTDEGLLLTKYQLQEKELRRALGFLSTESDLYRQTLLQILEVNQLISELEKVVEEQRLQMEWEQERQAPGGSDYARLKREAAARLRKNVFGEENYALNDNGELDEAEMKKEIVARLRRNAFGDTEPKAYDRNVGFNVMFEMISGLPRKYAYCQVVYAVYRKGEMVATPKMVEPHKCKLGHGFSAQCTFNENYTVFDVSQSMDALMIFEFQCMFESGIQAQGKPEAAGWTMIDLFDMMKTLKKGKWKLPVYFKPTNVNITMDRIKKLTRVREVWFYLRIGLPTDEIPAAEKQYDDTLLDEYEIPQMHKRYWNDTAPPLDDHQDEKENKKFEIDVKAILQTGKKEKEEKQQKGAEQKDIFKELFEEEKGKGEPQDDYERFKPRKEHNKPKIVDPSPFNLMEELAKADLQEHKPQQQVAVSAKKNNNILDMSIDMEFYKGLKLTIVGLRNFAINSKFKITGGLMAGNEFILDENARDCVFATKPRVLDDLFAYKKPRVGSDTFGMNSSGEESGELEETMAFNEDFYFLRDLPGLVLMKQNEVDLLLVLQVVAIDYEQPRKKKRTKTVLNDSDEEVKQDEGEGDLAAARKNIEDTYEFISWHVIKLNLSNGKLTRGRFIENLYEPPMKKPPFDNRKVAKTGAKIEFVIEEYAYDAAMLRKHKKNQKKKAEAEKAKAKAASPPKVNKKPTFKSVEDEYSKSSKIIQVKYRPFIENTSRQYSDHIFHHGNGIDFYIDGARFLPDNVTITKITLNVLTQDGGIIVKTQYGLPELESLSYSPMFKLKVELRANYFNPTSIALISIETVDSSNGQVRTIGYSAINLFVGGQTRQLPTSEAESEVILAEGGYQIPIYCQEPNLTKPFNLDKITKLDKIPCASLLVRIFKAPLSPDGFMVLSKENVPEKEWQAARVVIPTPNYGAGNYNTQMCQVTELERSLFNMREERADQPVKTKAVELMQAQGIQNPSDTEILKWIDAKLVKSNATELIDMTYFSKYLPQYGFKIAIDGFHNTPEKVPYVSLACLNPPGALHQRPIDANEVYLISKMDWESPITTPHFTEELFSSYNISAKKNLTLFLEVKSVTFKKDAPVFKTIGWTVVPVFNPSGYVQSGCYQLPVFKGVIPKDILDKITHNDVWPVIMELLAMKKSPIQLLEPMSAIVRVIDGQREGHFQRPFDYGRMNYRYLPQAKAHLYMYNAAVEAKLKGVKKLSSVLPKKVTAQECNTKIMTGLKENLLEEHR